MNIEEQLVAGKYRLPERESLSVHFPEYRGDAVVQYGTYVTNAKIPDSAFALAGERDGDVVVVAQTAVDEPFELRQRAVHHRCVNVEAFSGGLG
jgi:hypothetical protein